VWAFFNPYIILHFEDFDFLPNVFRFASIVDINSQVFSFVPTLVTNLVFHYSLDVDASISDPLILVMAFGFKVARRINCEFHVKEPILKIRFLDIGDKEMENVNKGGRKVSKHAKFWAKYAFDE
jgi:hypothetical protein